METVAQAVDQMSDIASQVEADHKGAETEVQSPEIESQEQDNPFKGTKHKINRKGNRQGEPPLEVEYEELVRGYGHMKEATAKFEEAAKLRKDWEAERKTVDEELQWHRNEINKWAKAIERLRGDEDYIFEFAKAVTGKDILAVAKEQFLNQVRYETASKEMQELMDAQREANLSKKQLEKYQKQDEQRAHEQALGEFRSSLDNDVSTTLTTHPRVESFSHEDLSFVTERAFLFMHETAGTREELKFPRAFELALKEFDTRFAKLTPRLQSAQKTGEMSKELRQPDRKRSGEDLKQAQAPFRPQSGREVKPVQNSSKAKATTSYDDFFKQFGI